MQINSNLSCIPFYGSLEEQDYRKWYAYGNKYLNRLPSDYLAPFFFVLPALEDDSWNIDTVEFYRSCCTDEQILGNGDFNLSFSPAFGISDSPTSDYSVRLRNNGLSVRTIDDVQECVYFAAQVSNIDLPRGLYYIKINLVSDEGEEYSAYSDIFFAMSRADISQFTKIEWYNMENLGFEGGVVPYEAMIGVNYFKNILYVDTEIGKPNYNFTEEGEERNGYFFPTKQISEKAYNMSFIAPEYLCDVMRLIRMSDVVKITDRLGRVYRVEKFETDVNWLEQGHYAEVSCTFQTDTVVKKVGKAYNNITDR